MVPAAPVHSPAETYLASAAGPWTRNGRPRSYTAASLSQYLGAEATRWLACDVVDVAVASYGDQPGRFAIAEIFQFHSDRDAFAAYSVRRDKNRNFAEIPDEAFRTRNSVVVWRGAAVVRVIGPEGGDHGPIDALVRAIVQPMAQSAGRPAGFEMFPPALLIPRSEVLTREPAFGYEFLRNSMMVSFNVGATGVEGLIHSQSTLDETQNAFQQYRQSVGRSAKTLDPVLKLGDEGFFAQDPMLGNIVAFRSGLSLVIFRGNARPEALIDLATATDARIRRGSKSTVASGE